MSYSFKGRVRYSEIGEDGCLTLPGIQNYYQDCCTFQSEEYRAGNEGAGGTPESLGVVILADCGEPISGIGRDDCGINGAIWLQRLSWNA